MPKINERTLISMQQELEKLAAPSMAAIKGVLGRMAGPGAGGAGVGGLLGAGGGAVLGASRGAREAKEQGGSSAAGALGGALQGIGRGALIGAAAGGLGGAAAGAAGAKGLGAALANAPRALGSAARFGQRQLHGVTGWVPEGGLQSIRGGAYDALKRESKAKASVLAQGMGASPKAVKELAGASQAARAAEKAEGMGLTSVPGYLKSLKDKPLETLRAGFDSQLKGQGAMSKAMLLGMPAYGVYNALSQETAEDGTPGKLERAGRAASGLMYAAAPLPLAGHALLGGAVSGGLARAGRVGDKLRKKKNVPAPPGLEPAGGSAEPVERIYTDRATGATPETLQ